MLKTINSDEIREKLLNMQDTAYRDFHSRLIPTVDKSRVIGVRTPQLRKFSKELVKHFDVSAFLSDLPHYFYEENNLHAFIIESFHDFDTCTAALDIFLPYVDNWATCDGLRPKCFYKNSDKLADKALFWIKDERTYVKRFGIGVLMNHFLDDKFDERFLKIVSQIESDEYYIKMMVAWYFATALAKQFDVSVLIIENRILDRWTHNKTIQKAVESYRITKEQKDYLKTLKY
ncbi:MAG: DNA alkylation repair protein [Ruminococcaceae bacterium]|nr:DNA alkylation repair protein [Oscillospiraceae bacterium]